MVYQKLVQLPFKSIIDTSIIYIYIFTQIPIKTPQAKPSFKHSLNTRTSRTCETCVSKNSTEKKCEQDFACSKWSNALRQAEVHKETYFAPKALADWTGAVDENACRQAQNAGLKRVFSDQQGDCLKKLTISCSRNEKNIFQIYSNWFMYLYDL